MKVFPETNETFRDVWEYYKDIRFSNLSSAKYRHVWIILFWPLFGLAFFLVERAIPLDFVPVSCSLDAAIPFCEYFVVLYYYWFVYLIGMLAYTLLFNVPAFRRCMMFIIITYTVTLVLYILFPSMQELRPTTFERHNIFTAIVQKLYAFDTNTNVCPSIHVLGSFAACFAGLECRRFATPGGRIFHIVSAVLICASTVFIKQHSILDVAAALVLTLVGFLIVYVPHRKEDPTPQKEEKPVVSAKKR